MCISLRNNPATGPVRVALLLVAMLGEQGALTRTHPHSRHAIQLPET